MLSVKVLVVQIVATLLFVFNFSQMSQGPWFAWTTPMVLIALVAINSFWFSRFVSWLIFAIAFFSFLALLSAFTLRWRLEPSFNARPFYMAILMYVSFIYVSLGQIKVAGRRPAAAPLDQ